MKTLKYSSDNSSNNTKNNEEKSLIKKQFHKIFSFKKKKKPFSTKLLYDLSIYYKYYDIREL